ncbi:MAG: hypothetical protein QOF67_2802, partial [Mycobacterium sp.]|nr:hypothetical protein [Mycobacterium sp.]
MAVWSSAPGHHARCVINFLLQSGADDGVMRQDIRMGCVKTSEQVDRQPMPG